MCVFVSACAYMHVKMCAMCVEVRYGLQKSVLSTHHVASEDLIPVIRLGSKFPYPLSHLIPSQYF